MGPIYPDEDFEILNGAAFQHQVNERDDLISATIANRWGIRQSHLRVTKCTDRTHQRVSIYLAGQSPKSEKETPDKRAILAVRLGNSLYRGLTTKSRARRRNYAFTSNEQ